jgi:hypothetical protein
MLSGCYMLRVPVKTRSAWCDYEYSQSFADGFYSHYCKVEDPHFVYDTESHEHWTEYRYTRKSAIHDPITGYFRCDFNGLKSHQDYYTRAVVYCYDCWGPLRNYEDGWYQGEEFYFFNM